MEMDWFEIGDYLKPANEGFVDFVAELMPDPGTGTCRITTRGGVAYLQADRTFGDLLRIWNRHRVEHKMRGGAKSRQAKRLIRALVERDSSLLAIFAPYTLDIWASWLDRFNVQDPYGAEVDIYVLARNGYTYTNVEGAILRAIENSVKKVPYIYNRGPFTRGFLFVDTTFNILRLTPEPIRYFLVLESMNNGLILSRWFGISFDLHNNRSNLWLPVFPLANIGVGIKNGGVTILRDNDQNRSRLLRVSRHLQDHAVSPLVGLWQGRLQRLGVLLDSAVFIPSVVFVRPDVAK